MTPKVYLTLLRPTAVRLLDVESSRWPASNRQTKKLVKIKGNWEKTHKLVEKSTKDSIKRLTQMDFTPDTKVNEKQALCFWEHNVWWIYLCYQNAKSWSQFEEIPSLTATRKRNWQQITLHDCNCVIPVDTERMLLPHTHDHWLVPVVLIRTSLTNIPRRLRAWIPRWGNSRTCKKKKEKSYITLENEISSSLMNHPADWQTFISLEVGLHWYRHQGTPRLSTRLILIKYMPIPDGYVHMTILCLYCSGTCFKRTDKKMSLSST